MVNVKYTIEENKKHSEPINVELLMAEIDAKHIEIKSQQHDALCALSLDYSTNYNLKQLTNILDFYGIPKKKMKKEDIVKTIVNFELEHCNEVIVEKRKLYWGYVNELKNDDFFGKYVIIDL